MMSGLPFRTEVRLESNPQSPDAPCATSVGFAPPFANTGSCFGLLPGRLSLLAEPEPLTPLGEAAPGAPAEAAPSRPIAPSNASAWGARSAACGNPDVSLGPK